MNKDKDIIYKVILKLEITEEDGFCLAPLKNIIKDTQLRRIFYAYRITNFGNTQIFSLAENDALVVIPNHWILFMAPVKENI